MAQAKVIKLTDNNNKTLLPITDSAYVQHKYLDNSITSVQDAINSLESSSDIQHISYDTTNGIVLSSGGNIKLGTSGLLTISYTSNVLTFGTTANNYSHPTDGANSNQGPSYVTPKFTADKTLAHSDKFVIPNFKVDSMGHVTAAGSITYQLPSSGNTDTRQSVQTSTSKYYIDGVTSISANFNATTAVGDGISYIQNGTLYSYNIDAKTSMTVGGKTVATVDDINSVFNFRGTVGTSGADYTSLPTSGVQKGWSYLVKTAGTWGNQTCESGDLLIAYSTSANATSGWTVVQNNIDPSIFLTGVGLMGDNEIDITQSTGGQVISYTITHTSHNVGTVSYSDKNITGTSGQQKVITGITVNNYGHVTGYSAAYIYSTDNNDNNAFIVANPSTQENSNATSSSNGMYINVWGSELPFLLNTVTKHSIKLVGSGKTTVTSETAGIITINTSAETLTHNIYAVVGKDAVVNDLWLATALGTSTTVSYVEAIS